MQRRWWWVTGFVVACWSPRETGPRSMVGNVLDPSGAPLAGVEVSTVEAASVTDAEGGFAVSYKEPAQAVQFVHGQVTYRRPWREADNGTRVQISTATVSTRALTCQLLTPCDATLVWDLPGGLEAKVHYRCDRNEPASGPVLEGAPSRASCLDGAQEVDVRVKAAGGGFVIEPPPVPLTVHLFTDEVPLPTTCTVTYNDLEPTPTTPATWEMDVFGDVVVKVFCDGIPARPRRLRMRDPYRLEVRWTRHTPKLALADLALGVSEVVLTANEGLEYGWTLHVPRSPDGQFHLPPLEPGIYGLGVNVDPKIVRSIQPARVTEDGVVAFAPLPELAVVPNQPAGTGILQLKKAFAAGDLIVSIGAEP